VKHTDKNIGDRIACVVEEFSLIDKVFSITLDNISSNAKAIDTLTSMFAGYLGSDPSPKPLDPNQRKYSLVHQCCVCHIINLIVKSSIKRFKPYIEDFRTAINFLNFSNKRIVMFKNYCTAQVLDLENLG
jgi:hypothetical protein